MENSEKKYRILIIDDDSFLLDMYSLKFSQANFEVESSLGPEPALEKINKEPPFDVILLDLIMPVMDGFEFLEKIKQENLIPNTIKIILSNKGQQSDIRRCKKLGADGYIIKANTTPSEVIEKVLEIIANCHSSS